MKMLKLGLVASLALGTALAGAVSASAQPAAAPAAPAAAPAAPAAAPAAAARPARPALSRGRVEALQTALAKAGETVAVDGYIGPKTVAALKDYQQKHNLKVTGRFDRETVKALGV
jgi:peptidoglycan hydrolase-like protein with peptidoglycan-binding domain